MDSGANCKMKDFKLLCDSFTHLTNENKGYTTHGKESKYIKWVHDGHNEQQTTFNNLKDGDETFYVDKFLPAAFQDLKSSKKYGIILECGWINQPIIDDVKNKLDEYMSCYDMIFTWSEELVNLHDRIKWIPGSGSWIKEPQIYKKNKLVSIIASNNSFLPGHKDRLEMIEQLKPYAPLFGKGFNEIKYKEEALTDYMFSVAIENMNNWFTEKLLDCFLTGTVPIFYGTPNVGKWFNLDGMIIIEDGFDIESLTEEMYYERKESIEDNFNRALKMEIVEDYIWSNYFE
jgi:hypothetical protein